MPSAQTFISLNTSLPTNTQPHLLWFPVHSSCHSSLLSIFRQNQLIKSALCPLPSAPIAPSITLELWRGEQKYPQLNTCRTQGGRLVHLHSLKYIRTLKKAVFVSGRTALLNSRTMAPLGGFTDVSAQSTLSNLAVFKSRGGRTQKCRY